MLIFGLHAVKARLQSMPESVTTLLLARAKLNPMLKAVVALAEQAGIPIQEEGAAKLDQLTQGGKHQGLVALLAHDMLPELSLETLQALPHGLILALDGITDPHNLGAILRSADAFGVSAILLPKDRSVHLTATVRKVAVGAAETVPIVTVTNLVRALKSLQEAGFWLYGLTEEGDEVLWHTAFEPKTVLVLGAEGQGLRRLTKEACDFLLTIPMQGKVSSLNVSVATAITLYEVLRQKKKEAITK